MMDKLVALVEEIAKESAAGFELVKARLSRIVQRLNVLEAARAQGEELVVRLADRLNASHSITDNLRHRIEVLEQNERTVVKAHEELHARCAANETHSKVWLRMQQSAAAEMKEVAARVKELELNHEGHRRLRNHDVTRLDQFEQRLAQDRADAGGVCLPPYAAGRLLIDKTDALASLPPGTVMVMKHERAPAPTTPPAYKVGDRVVSTRGAYQEGYVTLRPHGSLEFSLLTGERFYYVLQPGKRYVNRYTEEQLRTWWRPR